MHEDSEDVAAADGLAQRRARIMTVLAIVFLLQQLSFFAAPEPQSAHLVRSVDHLRISAWVFLSAVLLLVLATGGMWLRGRKLRALLNDEVARANRADALTRGFFAAMIAALIVYVLADWGQIGARAAIHIIVTAGIVPALLRFGLLERRALSG